MKVDKSEELILWVGNPQPRIFKYMIERSMTKEISAWLDETFKSYGFDYYYNHGEIWFKRGRDETLFLLRWT